MHALRILLRHRVTRWLRHPEWGTGTVVGQIVLLGLLLLFLWPVGMGSYMFGAGVRDLYPDLDVLRVLNSGMLYLGPQMRTPVDLSASAFSFNGSLGNLTGLALAPIILVVIVGSVVAAITGAWWVVAALTGGAGLLGLGGLAWTLRPFVRQLDRHRHEMVESFRENESI